MTRNFWEERVGSTVCGGYQLGELISATEASAVFLTSHGNEGAAIKLNPADRAGREPPRLDHPHIIRLFASGPCELDGIAFHYFVTEQADENLASVIASRPLSPDETREMLGPILEAVGYLHKKGLVHGRIKPSNILAKGDSVKLSCDSVQPAEPPGGSAFSAEEDMHALAMTITEVMSGPGSTSTVLELPQPFRDIVDHLPSPIPSCAGPPGKPRCGYPDCGRKPPRLRRLPCPSQLKDGWLKRAG